MKHQNLLKKLVLGIAAFALTTSAFAQQEEVLMTVGDERVSKQEFEYVFQKNNSKQGNISDEKTLREYLDLYTNFKLKVLEAKSLGMDTLQKFKYELSGYRRQLAAPYLTDKSVTEHLIQEAYDRSQKEIRASHILIQCAEDAKPKDTLAAYHKIMNLRKRIVEKKEDFGKLAEQYSDDTYAKKTQGDLGYFTAFSMVYPFETAAYTMKQGEVSMPVRTRYGYHLVKVTAIRPAQGTVKTAHIMVRLSAEMNAEDSLKVKAKIDEIYTKLQAGESFETLAAQYSEDKPSAKIGGAIKEFKTGEMVAEFEEQAFALKNIGDYSKPFLTSYGWHIVKMLGRKPVPAFEESKSAIKTKVSKDSRSELNKKSFIAKLKKEYKFVDHPKVLNAFYKKADSAIFYGRFMMEDAANPNALLAGYADVKIYVKDFAKHVAEHQINLGKNNFERFKADMYDYFINQNLTEFEESRLEQKYPEFQSVMNEYRDGILLFELTDEKIWSAAVKDSAGLEKYFEANKENYRWDDRVDASIYTCKDAEIAKQVRKLMKNKKITEDSLMRRMNKENPLNLTLKSDKFERGDNAVIDGITWVKGVTGNINTMNTVVFVNVKEVLPAQTKKLDEVRATVIGDFQSYLEKEWIKELKQKYSVKVNEEVFKSLIKQ